MKVQRVQIPDTGRVSWLVIGDDYLAIPPIREYLAYLENLDRSPHTIRAYAHHLYLYWKYLHEAKLTWSQVRLNELANFITWLRRSPRNVNPRNESTVQRSDSTINTILTAVVMFYDYHARLGNVEGLNLTRTQLLPNRRYKGLLHHITNRQAIQTRLLKLKAPAHFSTPLTPTEVEQLVAACHHLRDKLLILMLYETGMRIGQVLGLRHADIHSWDNLIWVVPRSDNANDTRAKTRQPFSIPVSSSLMRLYADYLVHELNDIESEYVFVNLWKGRVGAPMRYHSIVALFHRMSKVCGVPIHPHRFRHTHATELLRSGMSPALVQKRLGHASIQTTINTYAHLNDEDAKQAYRAYLETRDRGSA